MLITVIFKSVLKHHLVCTKQCVGTLRHDKKIPKYFELFGISIWIIPNYGIPSAMFKHRLIGLFIVSLICSFVASSFIWHCTASVFVIWLLINIARLCKHICRSLPLIALTHTTNDDHCSIQLWDDKFVNAGPSFATTHNTLSLWLVYSHFNCRLILNTIGYLILIFIIRIDCNLFCFSPCACS